MSILPILTVPNSILKTVAMPIEKVDEDIRSLLDDMLDTMYASHGVGLAAIQVGVKKRAVVLDLQNDDDTKRPEGFYPLYIINPVITEKSEDMVEATEWCLSVPGEGVNVNRHASITLKYLDSNGIERVLEANGWLARAIQHEINHLDGLLLTDYLSKLKKDMVINRITKRKRSL